MRNSKFILLGLVTAAIAPTFAIINGQDAKHEDFPWHVSLAQDGNHSCGGSIVSPNLIVTAQHCLVYNVSTSYMPGDPVQQRRGLGPVTVGMTDLRVGGKKSYSIKKTILMPKYDPFDGRDLALLVLDECIEYGPGVQPIAIADEALSDALVRPGKTVTAVGWGMSAFPDIFPDLLQRAELDVRSYEDADRLNEEDGEMGRHFKRIHGSTKTPRKTLIPAGGLKKEEGGLGTDTAVKDSGGGITVVDPVTGHRVLVGVVSWGNQYGGYVRLAHFKPWIDRHIEKYAKRCDRRGR